MKGKTLSFEIHACVHWAKTAQWQVAGDF